MSPGDALGIAVQVAVSLAGFTGVVAVFGTGTIHEWKSLDKLRLRLLLTMSTIPLALCLVGIVLLAANLPQSVIWRCSSGISAIAFSTAGFLVQRTMFRISPKERARSPGTRPIFYATGAAGTMMVLLLAYNTIVLAAFWPFFAAVITSLLAAIVQFIRLVFLRPAHMIN